MGRVRRRVASGQAAATLHYRTLPGASFHVSAACPRSGQSPTMVARYPRRTRDKTAHVMPRELKGKPRRGAAAA
ncbi:hypothetical protein RirG_012230 [Rhizophagus irregularis DAOM 197198w]|uniref:Uncharacterized protein n=1 Tax=Rhizophagus irregularis (strain DAOM 197198w) TaxID=1432141 RepID=A0A015KAH3_RHIIW|nr:hypothetical protein RirG_012230 [Rhizophagus irregularis DAOM 197198w]